jgi:hypothetical protein
MSWRAQNRIYNALCSKHSPLIAAIIEVDVDQIKYRDHIVISKKIDLRFFRLILESIS